MIVLDDAHWADAPTLLLLRHLVRQLGRDPVLFVVSFREQEVASDSPATAALADLAGRPEARWIRLKGLDRADLAQQLAAIVGRLTGEALAARIRDATGETRSSPPSWCGCSGRRDVWRMIRRFSPTNRSVCLQASARCCGAVSTA